MAKTTAEKIEVMQAFERGEEVQYKHRDNLAWGTLLPLSQAEPIWDWSEFEYRLKPKIRSIELHWAVLLKNNGLMITTNPKPITQHKLSLLAYENTAKVVKEYSDVFVLPNEIVEEMLS